MSSAENNCFVWKVNKNLWETGETKVESENRIPRSNNLPDLPTDLTSLY